MLRYTEDIRRDREGPNKWPIEWNDNRFTVNRIEWVAEMFGYVLALLAMKPYATSVCMRP